MFSLAASAVARGAWAATLITGSPTDLAGDLFSKPDAAGDPSQYLAEGQLDSGFEILARCGESPEGRTASAARSPPEDRLKNIAKVLLPAEGIFRPHASASSSASLLPGSLIGLSLLPAMAVPVVFLSCFRITQDFVRLVQLLKLLLHLCFLGSAVQIRMILAGQAAVGLLDLIAGGSARHSEDVIVIALGGCHCSTLKAQVVDRPNAAYGVRAIFSRRSVWLMADGAELMEDRQL